MTRILITDGETRAVLAAARGLWKAGFQVTVAASITDRPAPGHWSRAASERIFLPDSLGDSEAFIAALLYHIRREQYSVVLAGADASLLAISQGRALLEPHTVLGLPPHSIVERSLEKAELVSIASGHGLGPPRTIRCSGRESVAAASGELGFPVIVKPARTIVEREGVRQYLGSRVAGDETTLDQAVDDFGGECLVQALEQGAIVSFGGVAANGRLAAEAVSRYIHTWPVNAGNASFSRTIDCHPELRWRIADLLGELGWEGLFELELIERGDRDWAAIDFNPRPYGSLALAVAAGANLPAVWCRHLLGQRPATVCARADHFYRWEDADLRHALWQLRHGRWGNVTAKPRVCGGVAHAYFELRDPAPFAARAAAIGRSLRRWATGRPPTSGRVVVIGAGPYGLAAAAFLGAAGISVRCFGEPLEFWHRHMPAGMILRSRRRATHIADPQRQLTIDRYEQNQRRSLREPALLVEEFIDYATWFQRLAVPDVDRRKIDDVRRQDGRFAVRLQDGELIEADRVIVAAGLAPFAARPGLFSGLPRSLVSHSSDHADLGVFAGKRVIVIGAGQSALESAALLQERGAGVEVIARASAIHWLPVDPSPSYPRRRDTLPLPPPPTGVGGRLTGWTAAIPDAFRRLPGWAKPWVSYRCVRPAGSGWLRPRLADVPISCGRSIARAEPRDGGVWLRLDDDSQRLADHVLLATGYDVAVSRYPFLSPELAAEIVTVWGYPSLGPGLESSVPGLHFLGAPAAHSFGPVMRFVVGTAYAGPALTRCVLGRRQPPIRFAF